MLEPRTKDAAMLLFIASLVLVPPLGAAEREFEQVAPLVREHCLVCHIGAKAKAGLDLSNGKSALQGGDGGPVIIAGDPEESLLIQRIRNGSMPPEDDGRRLTTAEVQAFSAWIKAGAHWPADRVLKPQAKAKP